MFRWAVQFFVFLGIMAIIGCSSVSQYSPGSMNTRPSGIDSLVYRSVLNDSRILFISHNAHSEADTLKKKGKDVFRQYLSVDSLIIPQDTLKIAESISNQVRELSVNQKISSKVHGILEIHESQPIQQALTALKVDILDKSLKSFEKAYKLNPTDPEIMLYLSRVYHLLYSINTTQTHYLETSNQILHNILGYDRGDHFVYFLLAENERSRSEWKVAESYLLQAIDILNSYEFLPKELNSISFESYTDSLSFNKYLYLLGDTYVKLYNATEAIRALNSAMQYTNKAQDLIRIQDYINWINWAEGNIRIRELFEEATQLEKDEEYIKAASTYKHVLTDTRGKAQNAFWETAWRLSKIESAILCNDSLYTANNPFKEIGFNRLRQVIQEIPKDSSGMPQDTLHLSYMNDYSRMLWNEASRIQKIEGRKKDAERLFSEGSAFPSNVQGKCSLQMTRLYQSARPLGLFWSIKTYVIKDQLDEDELRGLFKLFQTVTHVSRSPILRNYFNLESHRILDRGSPRNMKVEDRLMSYELLRSGYQYISDMLYHQYKIRQDLEPVKEFDHLYRELERTLPVKRREEIRLKIYDYYYKAFRNLDYKSVIEDWKKQLRSLRISDEYP
ncbi:hypothetical protein HQ585_14450 [candidate division KSB1 bacterium]|nr:hypothetical protein [candidate division KSB1 bacterium]